jgi:hypothetical protein
VEDEEISAEEEQAVARSKEWFKRNEVIPFEQVVTDPASPRKRFTASVQMKNRTRRLKTDHLLGGRQRRYPSRHSRISRSKLPQTGCSSTSGN